MPNFANTVETNSPKTAIFICGPTAVGKTRVAITVARWLDTEIISFDSRQFYRELEIGAAPPNPEELKAARHHFIGHLSVEENLNAGEFEKAALHKLSLLFKKHNQVVLVGGSGLFMKAITEGFDEMPAVDSQQRAELNEIFKSHGLEPLQNELAQKDPVYYKQVDRQNPQRLIRALEVIRSSGKPYSFFRRKGKATRPFKIIKIGLNLPREKLYERINLRVDQMLENGLEEEVKSLMKFKKHNALQTVGYKELFRLLEGTISQKEAIEEIKKNTRRYAKRQLTWFKRDSEVIWFNPEEIDKIKQCLKAEI